MLSVGRVAFRKLNDYSWRFQKKIVSAKRSHDSMAVLVNSIPKSGTHLLIQIIDSFPSHINYHDFIASIPGRPYREVCEAQILKKVEKLAPREVCRGHIYYHEDIENISDIVHYFIYRDPRDVAISEANYLYDMNFVHQLHPYYKTLHSLEERIKFSILGNRLMDTRVEYPDIKGRLKRYIPWMNAENVHSVRYEDLVTNPRSTIDKIVEFYELRTGKDLNKELLTEKALRSIDPGKSHTFRGGGIGKWKSLFNEEHISLFKEYASDLLDSMNYDWN